MSALPFGDGPMSPCETTERVQLMGWLLAHQRGPADELAAVMTVAPDVISRRRAELGARLRGEQLEPVDGYGWTRERIDGWVAGVSHGKAVVPAKTEQPEGPGTLLVEWPDGDWAAWRRHPQRHDLWAWVEAAAEPAPAPAPASPALEGELVDDRRPVDAPAPEWERGGPTLGTDRRAGLAAPGPAQLAVVGQAAANAVARGTAEPNPCPSVAELAQQPRVPAPEGTDCCVCFKPVEVTEIVRELRGWVAHDFCAPAPGMKLPEGATWGADDGDRVRKLRESTGRTQKSLEGILGASRLSRIENGKTKPTEAEAAALAKVFGVTTEVVLGFSLPPLRRDLEPRDPEGEESDDSDAGGDPRSWLGVDLGEPDEDPDH